MKFKIMLLILLVFSTTTFAQLVSGQILNESTKEPIFGVTISSKGMPYAFSDQEGKFEIEDASKVEELSFSHLAYGEIKIKITAFTKSNQIVYLTEKVILLNEVQVGSKNNDLTVEEIIVRSSKTFQESIKRTPYFAKSNLKQIIIKKNAVLGFLEIDGINHNFVSKDRNPFIRQFILPLEYRKNKENAAIREQNKSVKYKEMYNYFATDYLMGVFFINFQTASIIHPLDKKNKYSFQLQENIEIDGTEFYKMQFFQKKGIRANREIYNVYGELLISKKDFSLFKYSVNYDFDNVYSNFLEIEYETIDFRKFVHKITSDSKFILPKSKKQNTLVNNFVTIDNSKIFESKDFSKFAAHSITYYIDELQYHPNYWKQKTTTPSTELIDNYLKTLTLQDFEEGAKQNLLDTTSKYFTKDLEEYRKQQIKLHEDTLKYIKL